MTRSPSHICGKSNSSSRPSLSQFKIFFEIFYRKEKVLIASLIFFIPITRQPPGSSFMFLLLEAGSSTLSYPCLLYTSHPVMSKSLAAVGFRLRDLIFVMRKLQVLASCVNVYSVPKVLLGHGRTFDMPSRSSHSPRRLPRYLASVSYTHLDVYKRQIWYTKKATVYPVPS